MQDPRITSGLQKQKANFISKISNGEKLLGWKLGFGSETGKKNLQITSPLTGYLLESAQLENGSAIDIYDWIGPVAETEIAIYFDQDITSYIDYKEVVSSFGPAIELADLNYPPVDPEKILEDNIYQKNIILGERTKLLDLEMITATVNGEIIDQLTNLTGNLEEVLPNFIKTIIEFYGKISKDQFVILGSIVPPIKLLPGQEIQYELQGFKPLTMTTR